MTRATKSHRESFPCNGCTACCRNETLQLWPEKGDRIEEYLTRQATSPFTGETVTVLQQRPNGDCIYVDETGCTIHDRRPWACRRFNCVAWLEKIGDELDQMAAVAKGRVPEAVYFAAKARS